MAAHGLTRAVILYGTPRQVSGAVLIDSQRDRAFAYYSLSKPMTAATVLSLVGAGKISLDETVDGATVRDLLAHSAGWDRTTAGDPVVDRTMPADCAAIVPPGRQFAPGTRAAYSNLGYCLLGRLIAERTGESYDKAVRRSLPMAKTMTYAPWFGAAGGWSGTADAYYRFAARPVDSRALARPAFAPSGPYYAMGWRVLADGTLSHFGAQKGGYSLVLKTPNRIVVALFDGEPRDPERARDDLRRVLARYR